MSGVSEIIWIVESHFFQSLSNRMHSLVDRGSRYAENLGHLSWSVLGEADAHDAQAVRQLGECLHKLHAAIRGNPEAGGNQATMGSPPVMGDFQDSLIH